MRLGKIWCKLFGCCFKYTIANDSQGYHKYITTNHCIHCGKPIKSNK